MHSLHDRTPWLALIVIGAGIVLTLFPVWIAFTASTLPPQAIARGDLLLPGAEGAATYRTILFEGARTSRMAAPPVSGLLWNSLIMALVIAAGKIAISVISAYAVVFFSFPGRMLAFWTIFITLMLPVEVRIVPTYQVVAGLGMLNTYAGLTVPLIASATATLLFRQFFLTIPDELVEAAKVDGAGPMRFFLDTVLPLSRTNIAALFVILFIYGWNQYLWPLLITTRADMDTIVIGITKMIGAGDALTDWNLVMATTVLAILPPALVVLAMQRQFVKGLVDTEK